MSVAMKSHAISMVMGRGSCKSSNSNCSSMSIAARPCVVVARMAHPNSSTQPQPPQQQRLGLRHRVLAAAAGAEAAAAAAAVEPQAAAPAASSSGGSGAAAADGPAPTSSVWELDFCSRPLLDERGKKVWELLVTDPERTFEYSQYFPNSKINSAELRKALEALLARPGAVVPERARFFRGQMSTIISKALGDVGVKAVPSRRCFAIMALLEERLEAVYKRDARYSDRAATLFNLDLGAPEPLPDALRGEKWAFVQLPLGPLLDMAEGVGKGSLFGASLSLSAAGLSDLPRDVLVPGVAVFSRRATPLAAWTNGLEIAGVRADVDRGCLVLETGVNQRWRYGGWRASAEAVEEAAGWEEAKQAVGGLHFLAVQPDPDAPELSGLWLLRDVAPPRV